MYRRLTVLFTALLLVGATTSACDSLRRGYVVGRYVPDDGAAVILYLTDVTTGRSFRVAVDPADAEDCVPKRVWPDCEG